MKNLLLFLTCLCLSAPLFSQTPQWLLPGARWTYSYESLSGPGEETLEYVGIDTVGGELCAKLHWYGYHYGFGQGPFNYGHRYLFARNDSVFYWDQGAFRVLYDFTRQTGDTIWINNGLSEYALIQATGDTIWNGIPVRFQDLLLVHTMISSDTLFTPTRVYERLGGHHLLYWDIESPLTEIQYTLVCYRDSVYPQPDCVVAAPVLPALDAQIQLYPNPASGQVTLEIPAEALPATLMLYDPLGRVLKMLEVDSPRTTVLLDISGPDWLLVQIRSWDGRTAGRKVKM